VVLVLQRDVVGCVRTLDDVDNADWNEWSEMFDDATAIVAWEQKRGSLNVVSVGRQLGLPASVVQIMQGETEMMGVR
jgi:hypothetical protein